VNDEKQDEYEKRLDALLGKINLMLEHEDVNDVILVASKIVAMGIMQISDADKRTNLREVSALFIDALVDGRDPHGILTTRKRRRH
jgi:uncharacterized membrane protein